MDKRLKKVFAKGRRDLRKFVSEHYDKNVKKNIMNCCLLLHSDTIEIGKHVVEQNQGDVYFNSRNS